MSPTLDNSTAGPIAVRRRVEPVEAMKLDAASFDAFIAWTGWSGERVAQCRSRIERGYDTVWYVREDDQYFTEEAFAARYEVLASTDGQESGADTTRFHVVIMDDIGYSEDFFDLGELPAELRDKIVASPEQDAWSYDDGNGGTWTVEAVVTT